MTIGHQIIVVRKVFTRGLTISSERCKKIAKLTRKAKFSFIAG
jgi:hypothetical protein